MKVEKITDRKISPKKKTIKKLPKTKAVKQTAKNGNKKLVSSLNILASQNAVIISPLNINSQQLPKEEFERRKKELADLKYEDGTPIFVGKTIEAVANFDENIYQKALKLTNLKDMDNDSLFDGTTIKTIAQFDEEKFQRVLELANMQDSYGINLFSGYEIENIAQFDDDKYKKALKLSSVTDDKGNNLFSGYEIENIAQFDDDKYKKAFELAKIKDLEGRVLFDGYMITDIIQLDDDKYQRVFELVNMKDKNGECIFSQTCLKLMLYCEDDNIYANIVKLIKSKNIKNRIIDLNYNQLQNNMGTSVDVMVEAAGSPEKTLIYLYYTINPDGSITSERTETYLDGTVISWYLDGNSSFINIPKPAKSKSDYKTLKFQAEIIYDEKTKEPTAILTTKKSDILDGVYEKTLYTLSDYDENDDVLKAISNGKIKGGKKLSYVKQNPCGSVTYHEKLNSNGLTIKRKYTKGTNGIDYRYSFKITDENGAKILDNSISFIKNSTNQTTTVFNGETYIAQFDDKTKTITITGPDKTEIIDFKEISPYGENTWNVVKNLPVNLIQILKNTFWDEIENDDNAYTLPLLLPRVVSKNNIEYDVEYKDKLIHIVQKYDEENNKFIFLQNGNSVTYMDFDADIYYDLNNHTLNFCQTVIKLDDKITLEQLKQMPLYHIFSFLKSRIKSKKISAYLSKNINGNITWMSAKEDMAIIAHELGHVQEETKGFFNLDKNLINLYNGEIAKFNSRFTKKSGKEYIEYFSQTGGSNATGLSEIIAETNMLLTTYGHTNNNLSDRAQFLVQNFPKTISYIANKLGMNIIE